MDREILFRGKRLDNGEWVEGSYMEHYYSSRFGCVSAIFTNDDVLCKTYRIPVDPSVVGQYTGLTDKNGVKIFEGDLLSYNCGDEDSEPREVCFLNGRFVVQWVVSGDIDDRPYQTIRMAKVIGNIHDNPELIGGEDDG